MHYVSLDIIRAEKVHFDTPINFVANIVTTHSPSLLCPELAALVLAEEGHLAFYATPNPFLLNTTTCLNQTYYSALVTYL